jgi:anti-sigma-K factor RskA
MKHISSKIGEQLAAEFVLGTMPRRTRQRFEALLKTSPQLRKAVAEWESRLTPMATAVSEVMPPAHVWKTIQNRVSGNRAPSQERQSQQSLSNWWTSLGFWRTTAAFATVSMFALGLLILAPAGIDPATNSVEFDPAVNSMMVVVMEDPKTQAAAMTASWEPGGERSHRMLRLRVVGHAEMAPDTAWELWVLPREFCNRLAHVANTEGQRQRNAQLAAKLTVLLMYRRFCLIKVGEYAGTAFVETASGIREIQATRRSLQQLHAETLLERCHSPADGRLRHVETLRGSRKAAGFYHRHERLQIFESIHIVAIFRTILFSIYCLF